MTESKATKATKLAPEYGALLAEMEAAKENVKTAGQRAVKALFAAAFEKWPAVTAFGWTQYTPHFNDGDPCEFSVHSFYLSTKTGVDFAEVPSLYDGDGDDDAKVFFDEYEIKDKALAKVHGAVSGLVDDDIFEAAFGDGVMVIATRDGFHVSDYSHD